MREKKTPAVFKSTPGRRMPTTLPGIVALLGITLLVVGSLLANRPHWRTLTLPNKTGRMAVTFDCPDDWVVPADKNTVSSSLPTMRIKLQRKPPTGFIRWWMEHVLHSPPGSLTNPAITVTAYSVSETNKSNGRKMDMDSMERMYKKGPFATMSGFAVTTERGRHALGPCLHLTFDITPATLPAGVSLPTRLALHSEGVLIYPPHAASDDIAVVNVSYSAPAGEQAGLQSMFNRIAQSVHLIKK